MRRPAVLGIATLLLIAPVLGATSAAARDGATPGPSSVSTPTVTGPITGGKGAPVLVSTTFDLGSVGYVEEEFFLSGVARAFTSSEPLTPDGVWRVQPAGEAPYTTRVVVRRPERPKDFNGTVVVEWLNVTAGFDSAPDWGAAHTQLIRAGSAWIGVSAQAVGVQGGGATVGGIPAGGVKALDPERYGPLSHPGDAYAYDIFSQVGRAARGNTGVRVLGRLVPERVIGVGESQSAFALVTYVNGVHPVAGVFDGFLLHSRGGGGGQLGEGTAVRRVPQGTVIRDDIDVPVLVFQTESDVIWLGSFAARQPDSATFRLWEVAGTAHADSYTAGLGFSDIGDGAAEMALLDVAAADGGPLNCTQAINAGPGYLVLNAAVAKLDRWIRTGTPPTRQPRLTVDPGPPPALRRDRHGNALGGIRTPLVDVPTAMLRGDGNAGGTFCALFGRTAPFDATTLASLYPTHADYVRRFARATEQAVRRGVLLAPDARNLVAAARATKIPR